MISNYLLKLFTRRAKRDLRRAAQFLWNNLLAAPWSIFLHAITSNAFASSALPAATASRTLREAVFIADLAETFLHDA